MLDYTNFMSYTVPIIRITSFFFCIVLVYHTFITLSNIFKEVFSMYQNLYHDLALTITELSRCATDELEHENSVYQKVLLQRNTAADELHQQLPKELQKIWDKYQILMERYHFMEQELQFFKGYCSYPILMGPLHENSVSHQKLLQELLKKFR